MSNLRIITLFLIGTFLILISCSNEVETSSGPTAPGSRDAEWLIPANEVFDGGPGKDGIPAISSAKFVNLGSASYLSDNDLIIGIRFGNEIRAYSHPVLDWHEIVNDNVNDHEFALNYCPLTGSGMAWNRKINGTTTTFGVSGLLYNTNLIPYDRASGSNWSQMKLMSVNGTNKGMTAELYSIVETTWKTWKELYPNSKVISTETQYSRPYGSYPYGDYRTNNSKLIFPISNNDTRLQAKERVLGVLIDDVSRIYPIERFSTAIEVVSDAVNGVDIIVVGSSDNNFAAAFESVLIDGTALTFEAKQNDFPAVMVDNEGTAWDLFGYGLSGPRAGQSLVPTRSFISYWFAWGTFYPDATIHQ